MTNTQSLVLVALTILALAIIWISYWVGRRDGLEKGKSSGPAESALVKHYEAQLAKASRELFAQKLDSATKIEALQRANTGPAQSVSLTLKVDTKDLRVLYRLAAVLTLAADTFAALRAEPKALEARNAARDCLALAESLKASSQECAA